MPAFNEWSADPYILVLTGLGFLIALVAWLPLALKRAPLSLPIVCVALGAALFSVPRISDEPLPLAYPEFAERFTELVVIVALMGAGLKLDRPFSWVRWTVTWRLLAITMPLSIFGIVLLGVWALGLPWAIALLLAASLAPTDPVLAADVQVGPPKSGEEDEVRFGLTSEAGLNDGFAFPFVNLAIALGLSAATGDPWVTDWVFHSVIWEIGAGIAGGWLVGRAFGWLTFHVPADTKLAKTGDGLIALAATFVSYGLTELVKCYGFLAVFVTALTLRHAHREHEFHRQMHDVTEQVERLLMMILLVLFGGALVSGLLAPLRTMDILAAVAILLVIRPATGLFGLAGSNATWSERLPLAFFGIRGVGSFYYLAYGLNHLSIQEGDRLWAIVGVVVSFSIILHGTTVTPAMRWLDQRQGRDPDADQVPPPGLQGPSPP
ncbi:cation:proton antiporter [Mesorhizobium sp. YIM 152430]|uniref:cation:proton antiporter n=1 Tax=Mesorhizobium sp. YIM 152430 TaxID=3031761 RepID=UPI0023D9FFF9|nr:cation:proton antiporter [Mesorhizobium sp. YIM 152430]MDF1600873.1 cation:proton antiporter [Mesorhizobium sp. YIM 152430]